MTDGRRPILEIAVTSPADAAVAAANGADRVELCQALEVGGLGPTPGQIERTVATGVETHVLVRPRPGHFVFSHDEVVTMEHDVAAAVRLGAAGVVIGALTPEARLDLDALRRLIAASGGGVEVTLHRAIDRATDPVGELPSLEGLGIVRVLTSGGAPTVAGGIESGMIARMVDAAGALEIMAGGGLRVGDVAGLRRIGLSALHLSASVPAPGSRVDRVGRAGNDHRVTDGTLVAAIHRRLLPPRAQL